MEFERLRAGRFASFRDKAGRFRFRFELRPLVRLEVNRFSVERNRKLGSRKWKARLRPSPAAFAHPRTRSRK
jgi:hypothetical protein